MTTRSERWLIAFAVLVLMAAACTSAEDTTTTTTATTTTTIATTTSEAQTTTTTEAADHDDHDAGRSLDAPEASITVDGDPSDWDAVTGLALTLEPIEERVGDPIENKDVTIKIAHDAENIYALFTVDDDYNWDADDAHLSAAPAWLFPVDTGGPHMGAEDHEGEQSTGMVDIWHWELECALGEPQGGATGAGAGDGDPGNDAGCNFDDEWATDAETREDDNGTGAENSLLGVFTHSNPVEDGPGVWYFEVSRPLQTGDEQDAQFTVGEPTLLALAYWDPDFGFEGWDDSTHVVSANQEWIQVNLT